MFHSTRIDTQTTLLHVAEYGSGLVITAQFILLAAAIA